MKKLPLIAIPLIVFLVLAFAGCAQDPAAQNPASSSDDATEAASETPVAEEPTLEVATLSYPVHSLLERLGGEGVQAHLVAPEGEDPPFWRPPAEVILELQDAELIVMNGAGYEKWTEQANLPLSRLLDSASELDLIETTGRTHSHGTGGEHSHAGLDPHTWMDPDLYLEQARRIAAALRERGVAGVDDRLQSLEAELGRLASGLEEALYPLRGRAMAANHPSFAYLARRFELEIDVIDLDPQGPSEKQIAALGAWAEAHSSAVLLWEEEPSQATRAAIGAGTVGQETVQAVIDPLEQPAEGGYDYLEQARTNVKRFRQLVARLGPTAG